MNCGPEGDTQKIEMFVSYPVHTSYIDGCAAGLLGNDGLPVAKRWRVMVTDARVASGLNFFRCDSRTATLSVSCTTRRYCVGGFWRVWSD